ncbi:MAG: hypothetical protein JKY27_11490 [Magnetovibrio sp.]|nr:hypothetical protein [Magnetovibrio sp.]
MRYDKNNNKSDNDDEDKPWHPFWGWLLNGSGAKPGYCRLKSKWLYLDVFIAFFLAFFVKSLASSIATGVLIPLSGIFIAMITASMSNTNAHISSHEFEKLYKNNDGGMDEYIYPYILSSLCFLSSIVVWSIAATTLLDGISRYIIFLGFFLTSLSVRVSWKSLLGSAYMAFAIHEIREHQTSQDQNKNQ